jgi:uncharacterized lipoprotein YmbA
MRILLLLVLTIVSTGCAVSDTTRYYALASPPTPEAAARPAAESGLTIGVGPVVVPGYLDRPHVVTRDASDGLEIWSYHRWAEPLDLGIAQALAEALAASVPADRIAVFPWRGTLARILDYQVVVAVARFEGSPGRGVTLDARWRILSRDGKELAFKRTTLTEPVPGEGFPALVTAMNRSIGRLAQDVGEAIRSQSANRAATR